MGEVQVGKAVLPRAERGREGAGRRVVDPVVRGAERPRGAHPPEVEQLHPGGHRSGDEPGGGARPDAVAGDGEPGKAAVRRTRQAVGEHQGTVVPQPGGRHVQFAHPGLGDQLGERCRTAPSQRIAAQEDPFDPSAGAGRSEKRVGEDQEPRRVETRLNEVERAQRPYGVDEFGRRTTSRRAQRIAFQPDAGHHLR
ncbi:hypothetical protein ABZ953_24885 [Streptomyces sp. NPDC046465]|uniref:hypothetical protein n=1 Tax=Streptomyces sp. NPDC046465 TaxID=3155810 RepID=UPI0033EC419A